MKTFLQILALTLALVPGLAQSKRISLYPSGTPVSGDLFVTEKFDGSTNNRVSLQQIHTITATGSTASRTLQERTAEMALARDYGVIGSDGVDDTAALTNAVWAAIQNGYRAVQLPPGVIDLSDTIRFIDGVKLFGAKGGAQFFAATNMHTILKMADGLTNAVLAPWSSATNYVNVEIRDVIVQGGDTTEVGIDFTRVSYSILEQVAVHACDYGVIIDAQTSNQAYFNHVRNSKLGYNRTAGLLLRNGANDNLTQGVWFGGQPYSILTTNSATANVGISDHHQGVASPVTLTHIWNEGGVYRSVASWFEAAVTAITNSTTGRLELFAPTFGGGLTNYVMSGSSQGIGVWTQPITSSQGFRGWRGTLRETNDWFSTANNFIFTLDPYIRSDLSPATNLNYIWNYGSEVVIGDSGFIFYGNNSGGTQNTNAIAQVNLKNDGAFEALSKFFKFQLPGARYGESVAGNQFNIQSWDGTTWRNVLIGDDDFIWMMGAVQVGTFAGDPSSLTNGMVWYNSNTGKFRKYENGAASDLDTTGGGSGANWTADGGTNSLLAGESRQHSGVFTNSVSVGSGAPGLITAPSGGRMTNSANAVGWTNSLPVNNQSNVIFESTVTVSNGVGAANQVLKSGGAGNPPFWADPAVGATRRVWVDAGAMVPVSPAEATTYTPGTTTDGFTPDAIAFDAASTERAQWKMKLDHWNGGQIDVQLVFTSAGTGSYGWTLEAGAISDEEVMGNVLGSATVVTLADVSPAHELRFMSFGAYTVGSSPAQSATVYFRVSRIGGDAADDGTGDAFLLGAWVFYQESSTGMAGF